MGTVTGSVSPLLADAVLADRLADPEMLAERQLRADRLLAAEGAGYLVHDLPVRADGRLATVESRPWRIDPIPVVLDPATFRWLSLAVAERMEALEAVLADLYGDRTLVRARVVPAELLAATPRYRVDAVGWRPRRWLATYAVDVAVDVTGKWWVVQDLTDAPPGIGYSLLDRSVQARVVPEVLADAEVASLARFPARLRAALAAVADEDSPRIVLFSGGLDHPSYVEHSYLAVQLGVNLVEGADLVVRQRRVWLRTLDGLEPVDVLYRRLDDPLLDPLAIAAHGSAGVPGLLQAAAATGPGPGVMLANAYGSGVLEAPELRPFLAAAIDAVAHPEQSLPQLGDPTRPLAHMPLAPGSAAPGVESAAVVVRLFAVHDGRRIHVLPGGTGRVLAGGDHPAHPTAATAKDVWVLGQTTAPMIGPRLPQVDFAHSVPTRAADALYWTNRAAERAEAMARTMQVVTSRIETDHGLLGLDQGAWTTRMRQVLAAVHRVRTIDPFPNPTIDTLAEDLAAVGESVAREIGALLTEATTVREFMSVTSGRVLGHLAVLRNTLQRRLTVVDDLDAVLADFAALTGLWQESTVRGPAWRIGDTGRRLERILVVLDLIDAACREWGEPAAEPLSAEVEATTVEVLLAANDSLVSYRRAHRSDVERGLALHLLVGDATNPRSIASSLDHLARHVADGETALGEGFLERAGATLHLPVDELVPALRELVEEAGRNVVARWFSTPVNPIGMRPRGLGGRP